MIRAVSCLLSLIVLTAGWAAELERTIPNPLRLDWPHELVHFDLPAAWADGPCSVIVGEEARPVQVERAEADGGAVARAWFIATLRGAERFDKKRKRTVREKPPEALTVTFQKSETASPLRLRDEGGEWVVQNGVYAVRVPKFDGAFREPKPLKDVRPPVGRMKLLDGGEWMGRAWFDGNPVVRGATTEVLARGPVFITVKVAYDFAAEGQRYEATLRFVAGDPWIDVTERHGLPRDPSLKPWGIPQYWIEWGDGLRPETVMWIRWFDYGKFGGNVDLHFVPCRRREGQRGPFVMLRPRWTQMPGGGQDFFVTRGGRESGADPDEPAVGLVATYPAKWVNPYAQTIRCYVEEGHVARARFPLLDGARAYALCVGPRSHFDSTGELNGVVRRHTDWTLDDQIHDYILEWKRDPSKAGPHILVTRTQLRRLQADWAAGRDTLKIRLLKQALASEEKLGKTERSLAQLIQGKPVERRPKMPTAQLWLQRRYQDDFLNPTTYTRRVKKAFPLADLFAHGQSLGDGWSAALGYVFTDLDHWPGYLNGWGPGNPNFHTDKYMVAIFAGAAMLDHPHAEQWLDFGRRNFEDDVRRVLLPPDGVGYECPGYSTYSLGLQLEIARVFLNIGRGNPVAENPLFRKSGRWHRKLLTPRDIRLGIRHQAPIGDTHRWGADDGVLFGRLAAFYKEADPAFAREMMGIYALFRDQGMTPDLLDALVRVDHDIEPMPAGEMDWSSEAFEGFGAVLRSRFGTDRETFCTLKAGRAQGHYHNDDLSIHFYGVGRPLALDYNCSYHPRGDHAALHNSMTFGIEKPFKHHGDAEPVPAAEQLTGSGRVLAFESADAADLVVAERRGDSLLLSPVEPEDAKFQYPYPRRKVAPIIHRRTLILVKHPEGAELNDYLVVRDETTSREPQQLNLHLLARGAEQAGRLIRCRGQWDADATLFLAYADEPELDVRHWHYFDEWMDGPGKWVKKPFKDNAAWVETIKRTDGRALIPPEGWSKRWRVGEYQTWLRIATAPGTPLVWVLYPRRRGEAEPSFEVLPEAAGVRVRLGDAVEDIHLAASRPAAAIAVQRGEAEAVLLKANALPPLGTGN
jgi:hypothetical protein